jgi:UDP:flavonoid glycosyltransferase YjiC (YdhE family)
VRAVERAGGRAIIQGWEVGLGQLELPPSIYAAGSLPHGWLLPRCAGIVHHGGYGTTAAGLRAGLPALVIPHIADQFYWGQQVYDLGVGPKPVRHTELDEDRLVAALQELVGNEGLRQKASQIGEQIRTEQGVEEAVRLIEATFA